MNQFLYTYTKAYEYVPAKTDIYTSRSVSHASTGMHNTTPPWTQGKTSTERMNEGMNDQDSLADAMRD
jgi:hypothetical protein